MCGVLVACDVESAQTDLKAIIEDTAMPGNRKRATIVRIGEKRLLHLLQREMAHLADLATRKRTIEDDNGFSKRLRRE